MSSSGDKMTSSPTEMRTTPKRAKSQRKADDDADTERLPPEPPLTRAPTSPNSGYANESYNLRQCAWVDDADNERLPPRHRILTMPGWTTLTQSSYLHAIASANAQGSVSQIQKTVHENKSQIQKLFNIEPFPSSRTSSGEAK